jgi:hypothetical protein
MKKVFKGCLIVFLLSIYATTAKADVYGNLVDQMRSYKIADLTSAYNTVLAQPDSNVRNLFLSYTSIINAIVALDGGEVTTIAEIMQQYGLKFTDTLIVEPIFSMGENRLKNNTKDLEELRVFLKSWKNNVDSSLVLLAGIPESFEYIMTMPDGKKIQLDYTDVEFLKCGLHLLNMGIEIICAHQFDGTIKDIYDNPSHYLQKKSLLPLRSDNSEYLRLGRLDVKRFFQTYKAMLESARNEPETPAGVRETFTIQPDKITKQISLAEDALYSITTGTALTVSDDQLGKVNLNIIFDGKISIGEMLPKFFGNKLLFSTFGYRLGNDATMNGLFPDATQKAWNMEAISRLNFFPYVVEQGTATPINLSTQMVDGGYSGTFKTMFNWEKTSVNTIFFDSPRYFDPDLDINNSAADFVIKKGEWSLSNIKRRHKVEKDKLIFRETADEGILEYTFHSNGDIDISTNIKKNLDFNVIYSCAKDVKYLKFSIDGSNVRQSNVKLVSSDISPTVKINLVPAFELLLNN